MKYFYFFMLFSSCAQLEGVDKSNLNQRAMNFQMRMTNEITSNVTFLNGVSQNSQAGCVTCAK